MGRQLHPLARVLSPPAGVRAGLVCGREVAGVSDLVWSLLSVAVAFLHVSQLVECHCMLLTLSPNTQLLAN